MAIVMERDVTRHFSRIAPKYTTVRTTDIQPVLLIREKLKLVTEITAASLGSGSGRYDLILLQHLKERLRLLCVDSNKEMLKQLITYLTTHGAKQFKAIHADVQQLPFYNKSLDCMFAFNSVHLFPIRAFLIEASRVLKRGGYLFIYTRFRSQNERNIWGRWFPLFSAKEKRLYELIELKNLIEYCKGLEIESVKYFTYKRSASLKSLVRKAKNFHYSTFCFYTEKEFEKSLKQFQENVITHFEPSKVNWNDENVLLVVRNYG